MNPFIGLSKATLEEMLVAAQKDYAAGKTVSEANAGDTGFRKTVQYTPLQRIEKILRALNLKDPVTYPASDIRTVKRTKIAVQPDYC